MTQRRRSDGQNLQILLAVAETLNSAPDVHVALTKTLALVADLLGLHTGWVWLLDAETGEFANAAALNLPPYLQEPIRMTGRACWCIDQFRAGEMTPRNINVMKCSRLCSAVQAEDAGSTQGLCHHASIPLWFQNKPLGIMNVTGPAWRRLRRDELRLLETVAYQVGVAIERARLAEGSVRLARVEERARIARDIHDTLAQSLTAIGLHIEGAMKHLDSDPDRARERLQRALDATRGGLHEARRSVMALRAGPLIGRPLAETLGVLAHSYTSETGIRVLLRVIGNGVLPSALEAELFRIAQEGLTNIRRHAQATSATLVLRVDANRARLVLHDNGKGCDLHSARGKGHGLPGMQERAHAVGGIVRLLSREGRGMTVAVTVPLKGEEKLKGKEQKGEETP
jgi:two-component system NarL family sensor kinase